MSHVALDTNLREQEPRAEKEKWILGGSKFWVVQKVTAASIFLSELEFLFEGFQKMLKYQKLTSYARLLQEIESGRRVVSMKRTSIWFFGEILVGTNHFFQVTQ